MEKYFFEAFEKLERLAPGSQSSTNKAIKLFKSTKKEINILDIGCGNGLHTILLAQAFPNASIIAIDNNKDYIKNLNLLSKKNNVSNRVSGLCVSMFDMPFEEAYFDLIWAEGSIYLMGFKEGINKWSKYIKKGGYLICSEISWITNTPSKKCYDFWNSAYPQITTISSKIHQIIEEGLTFNSSFILPKEDWLENYYIPLQISLDNMKIKYKNNLEANEVINIIQEEINLYYNYNEDYSYVFYSMMK